VERATAKHVNEGVSRCNFGSRVMGGGPYLTMIARTAGAEAVEPRAKVTREVMSTNVTKSVSPTISRQRKKVVPKRRGAALDTKIR
jgi:hypothetical protein